MDAKALAEQLYKTFKSQTIWKDIDFKRIEDWEKKIKKHYTLAMAEEIEKAMAEAPKQLVQITQNDLLDRIVQNNDDVYNEIAGVNVGSLQPTLDLSKEMTPKQGLAERYKEYAQNNTESRYYVEFIFNESEQNTLPNYQLFYPEPYTIAKNDEHKAHFCYIDTHDPALIKADIAKNFLNGRVVKCEKVADGFVPPRFARIWMGATKI